MRFVVLYRMRDDVRDNVYKELLALAKKGARLDLGTMRCPLFETRLYWPPTEELKRFPFNVQCEEVEISDEKIVALKSLIWEVSCEVLSTTPIDKSLDKVTT